jgi:hypothetical protein
MSHMRATLAAIKTIEVWRWRLRGDITGKPYVTRHLMTETDALHCDPLAERIASSLEVRMAPENEEETQRLRASAIFMPK